MNDYQLIMPTYFVTTKNQFLFGVEAELSEKLTYKVWRGSTGESS